MKTLLLVLGVLAAWAVLVGIFSAILAGPGKALRGLWQRWQERRWQRQVMDALGPGEAAHPKTPTEQSGAVDAVPVRTASTARRGYEVLVSRPITGLQLYRWAREAEWRRARNEPDARA